LLLTLCRYSYQRSDSKGETAVVRECFSTSILLGSISDPIRPAEQCTPAPVEKDATVMACICTNDFCNSLDGGSSAVSERPHDSPIIRAALDTAGPSPSPSSTPVAWPGFKRALQAPSYGKAASATGKPVRRRR